MLLLITLIRVQKLAVARNIIVSIDNGSKSSDDPENVYNNSIQNLETTCSDKFGDDHSQDGMLIVRFIKKSNGVLAGEKNINR